VTLASTKLSVVMVRYWRTTLRGIWLANMDPVRNYLQAVTAVALSVCPLSESALGHLSPPILIAVFPLHRRYLGPYKSLTTSQPHNLTTTVS
jgi:hypothetical protein